MPDLRDAIVKLSVAAELLSRCAPPGNEVDVAEVVQLAREAREIADTAAGSV